MVGTGSIDVGWRLAITGGAGRKAVDSVEEIFYGSRWLTDSYLQACARCSHTGQGVTIVCAAVIVQCESGVCRQS